MSAALRPTVAVAIGLSVATIGFGATAAPLAAQTRSESPVIGRDGHPFVTPVVSPLESVWRAAPVHVTRGDRSIWLGLADFGDQFPFWIRRRPNEKFELSGALHAKVATRFELEGARNRFVDATFRAGFYLRARHGALAARVELFHESSHLGDEYLVDEGLAPISTSREGLHLLVQAAPAEGLILYGGPGTLLRSTEDLAPTSLRAGAEWVLVAESWARPYASIDALFWSHLDWDPRIASEVGMTLGRNARIGLHLGVGPSRAGQFMEESETLAGLMFSYRRP